MPEDIFSKIPACPYYKTVWLKRPIMQEQHIIKLIYDKKEEGRQNPSSFLNYRTLACPL
ncbi:hypothetical protein V4V35_16320 [Bacillus infantis]|uniref:hypothetical protein n=1 Tax=Bacillus infantis TaxID=324767 RepID=UPI002FBECEF7